jgi:hypothetical protein
MGPFGVAMWKFRKKGWETFSKFVRYEVGDGSKVSFWYDVVWGSTIEDILFKLAQNCM